MPKELKMTSRSGRTVFRVVFRDLTPEEQAELELEKLFNGCGMLLSVLLAIAFFVAVGYYFAPR